MARRRAAASSSRCRSRSSSSTRASSSPRQGSYLVWKHLFETGSGEGARCLDVGCGCGILAVQLALNGAARVHAIDIDRDAVANTLANALPQRRRRPHDRRGGRPLPLGADERFDVVVASLYQMPVDPFEEPTGHRPLDYWGRNLLDHFLRLLPRLLAPDGVAYLMQLSIVGQAETAALLAAAGLQAPRRRLQLLPVRPAVRAEPRADRARRGALGRVPPRASADEDVMVAYLLEITRETPGD